MSAQELIPLTQVPTELRERFGVIVPYNSAWRTLRNGVVASEMIGGVIFMHRADLPRLAAHFGSHPPRSDAGRRRARPAGPDLPPAA